MSAGAAVAYLVSADLRRPLDKVGAARNDAWPVAPCDAPHRYEVSSVGRLGGSGDSYPGDKVVDARTSSGCDPVFRRYLGHGRLEGWAYWPTREWWADGYRHGVCLVGARRDVTGSLRRTAHTT